MIENCGDHAEKDKAERNAKGGRRTYFNNRGFYGSGLCQVIIWFHPELQPDYIRSIEICATSLRAVTMNQYFTIMKYSELREKVERGARFTIDFKKRTLRVNGKAVDISITREFSFDDMSANDILREIEEYYESYKRSVPSERSEKRQRNYFKALPYEQLTDKELCYGMHRETARFELEFYVLAAIISGAFTWQDDWGTWFWQSDTDKDLVILREWIEPDKAA